MLFSLTWCGLSIKLQSEHGNSGWVIENVDASDHLILKFGLTLMKWSREFSEKGSLLMLLQLDLMLTDIAGSGRT